MERALDDVRVVDLTFGVPGPFCTKMLAGLGAEVIKVERIGGDPARTMGPFFHDEPHVEKSALFLDLNLGKKSMTLDLRSAFGVSVIKELVRSADILIENFKPGTMARFGLGYETLEKINPRLVMASITNFGQTGPYRDLKASEIVFYATGGEMAQTGQPDRQPIRLADYITLYHAGNLAVSATMLAWYGARYHGVGQYIDLSIFEAAVGSVDRRMQYITVHAYNGKKFTREANHNATYPNGVYPCKDGYFEIAGGGPQFFPRTCAMIGRPELTKDPRFAGTKELANAERKDEFDAIFLPWVTEHTMEECLAAAQSARVYGAPVMSPANVVHNRHFKEREYFRTVDHPATGPVLYPGAPFKATETPWSMDRHAPLLGEHNAEVLTGELGLSTQDLAQLRAQGCI